MHQSDQPMSGKAHRPRIPRLSTSARRDTGVGVRRGSGSNLGGSMGRLGGPKQAGGFARGEGPSAEAGFDSNLSGFGAAAQARAEASLLQGEAGHTLRSPMMGRPGDRMGLATDVRGSAFAGGTASARGSVGVRGVNAGFDAFAGARAGASTGASVVWEKEDGTHILRDFADNLPGDWDDAMLDQLPDEVFENAARSLFGEGTVRLLQAEVGASGHAGVGASAGLHAEMAHDGLMSAGASAGAAAGVGAGVHVSGGVNPREILRYAVMRSMADTNIVFNALENAWRGLRGGQ